MSDEKFQGWQWLGGGALDPIAAAAAIAQGSMKMTETKFAIDLAPGDIISIGHIDIFVVGVRLQETQNPNSMRAFAVQVAGAEAYYSSNDWHWQSDKIMYDSPFLVFNPEQEVILQRQSLRGESSTLDDLISLRQIIHDKREKNKEKWEKASRWMQQAVEMQETEQKEKEDDRQD